MTRLARLFWSTSTAPLSCLSRSENPGDNDIGIAGRSRKKYVFTARGVSYNSRTARRYARLYIQRQTRVYRRHIYIFVIYTSEGPCCECLEPTQRADGRTIRPASAIPVPTARVITIPVPSLHHPLYTTGTHDGLHDSP